VRDFFLFLCLALWGAELRASSLNLFVYPPVKAIDWSSPSRALNSTFGNMLRGKTKPAGTYKSLVGHAIIHVECTDSYGRARDFWSAMSGQNHFNEDKKNLFERKLGLGVLFLDYLDGTLIEGEGQSQAILNYYTSRRGVAPVFMQMEISPATCGKLYSMHREFARRTWKPGVSLAARAQMKNSELLYYGGNFYEPLAGYQSYLAGNRNAKLGGGCTSYAVSYLKLAGHWSTLLERNWGRHIPVSEKLIGSANYPVSMSQVVSARSWTYRGWENKTLSFYEPEFMWAFIERARQCVDSGRYCDGDVGRFVNAKEPRLVSRTFKGTRTVRKQVGSGKNPVFRDVVVPVERVIHGLAI
jgi:hypothetical protein